MGPRHFRGEGKDTFLSKNLLQRGTGEVARFRRNGEERDVGSEEGGNAENSNQKKKKYRPLQRGGKKCAGALISFLEGER